MRVRRIDENNDWCFGGQNSDYMTGSNAVGLDIKLKLQEWLGDCFFALQNGIPWNVRMGKFNQKALLDSDVYNTAYNVEDVLSIEDFTSTLDGRRYEARFNVYQPYDVQPIPIEFTRTNIQ